jgi:hypothetical protein
MWTKGPSFPRHIPVDTAKIAPKALTMRTRRERKDGMEKPDRIVFISGIPDPEAMYITLPLGAVVGVTGISLSWPLDFVVEPGVSEADGSAVLVNIVAPELMIPKTNAIAT